MKSISNCFYDKYITKFTQELVKVRKNILRELLNNEMITVGARLFSPWPGMVEVIGHTGIVDYIEFEGEYSPWDLATLENIGRAIELFDMSSMMKVDQNCRAFIAQRSLGSGLQNMLFADVRTKEDAEECVRIVRTETPKSKGLNGAHARRSTKYGLEGASKEYVNAMDEAVVAIMIEKKEAIDGLEEILSVKGIDMIQFGSGDFSLSTGHAGDRSNPEVKQAEIKCIRKSIEMGVRPRIELSSINYSEKNILGYLEMGVKDFQLPTDVGIIYQWIKGHGEELRKLIASER
jgi:2-keto-3-deoxy-L-rhamnonate aldolase RhmA